MELIARLADELSVKPAQVVAAVRLLDEGATVPFIARYRKEVTGSLDDSQLRLLETRLHYLRELEERRETILASILEQGQLTPELKAAIQAAETKTLLEDLYLPYKPKRRTKAQIAKEAGLEPLALGLLAQPESVPAVSARAYLNPEQGFGEVDQVLEGARQILMERFCENATTVSGLREKIWDQGFLMAKVRDGKEIPGAKFRDYFEYEEALTKIPSHRLLALYRGRNEDVLDLTLKPGRDEAAAHALAKGFIQEQEGIRFEGRPADEWLIECVHYAYRIKLLPKIDLDLKQRLKELAEDEAIQVFARNLKDLLLAAPAGPKVTMGLDPGLRSGVKVAVIAETGKLLATATIYPHVPRKEWDPSIAVLAALARQHQVQLVAIGNGTASRETDQLVQALFRTHPDLSLTQVSVSEAGASVYSASELAALEFPDLDVTLRGAVSIARRLQDPLAELVKIEPKSIGVGQYQHDLNQVRLSKSLDSVVEDCVNAVGVDVNMASSQLLRYVSGLSATISQNIVDYRDQHGPFRARKALLQVPRLGDRAFEQSAGFLRIMGGDNPLDASAVHPEAYPLVTRMALATGRDVEALIGNSAFLRSLEAEHYVDDRFGLPTVRDILNELEKPGRDPRPEFKTAAFKDDVSTLQDLKIGMMLEGVVTNVANFGAFVDIGVHQDGLVHISHLADQFVKDPRDIVKAGDVVKVKVLEVDVVRKRIALSMKREAPIDEKSLLPERSKDASLKDARLNRPSPGAPPRGAMAEALGKAFKR
ncbi:MAG: RNA-binding transcriptional accessory protein [Gammaproteobacteria bacterium]|nr:RNA-binding transcriptional accessory protein [Gammaproteobacteria bacterium]NBT44746.1 RNA-binding transcriptional accessory protein [Gammaproteobacteria bacterium]NBY22120.1 RNA-binding transcriptional accessory protein [Gammaproteobacteria bacterium]